MATPRVLRVEEGLSGVWERIHQNWLDVLKIELPNSTISAQMQFMAKYDECYLVTNNKTHAENMFFTIFYDNIFVLKQIQKAQGLIDDLSDFQNWSTVVDYSGSGESDSTNNTNISNESSDSSTSNNTTEVKGELSNTSVTNNKTKGGESDDNSYDCTPKEVFNLEQEENSVPNINKFTQAVAKNTVSNTQKTSDNNTIKGNVNSERNESGSTENTGKSTNKNTYKQKTSDYSLDIRVYLDHRIPELRKLFWEKFDRLVEFV